MKYKIVIEKPAEKFIVKHPRLPCPNKAEGAGVFCTPNTMWGPANADPHRGTLSFVTQSSFVLVRSTTEGIVVGNPFLLSHRMGSMPGVQAVSRPARPLYHRPAMVRPGVL